MTNRFRSHEVAKRSSPSTAFGAAFGATHKSALVPHLVPPTNQHRIWCHPQISTSTAAPHLVPPTNQHQHRIWCHPQITRIAHFLDENPCAAFGAGENKQMNFGVNFGRWHQMNVALRM